MDKFQIINNLISLTHNLLGEQNNNHQRYMDERHHTKDSRQSDPRRDGKGKTTRTDRPEIPSGSYERDPHK